MGACLTQFRQAAEVLVIEANAVSDNPLVFAAEGDVISGGNFHAEPVAMAADNMALAIAEIGSLSERRISLMMDKHMSQLPPFLVANGGVNSGFMIAQVTAAALASENKALAHPHSSTACRPRPTRKTTCRWPRLASVCGKWPKTPAGFSRWNGWRRCKGLDLRNGLKTSSKLEQARAFCAAKCRSMRRTASSRRTSCGDRTARQPLPERTGSGQAPAEPVKHHPGSSLLPAKNVNDNAGVLDERGVLEVLRGQARSREGSGIT
jgi:hypothetical protein